MATVADVYRFMDTLAPFALQMSFDNAGFLVGRQEQVVKTVLVSLDITEAVVQEADRLGAELIVSHHPVIFHPLRTVTDRDPVGRTVLALARRDIAAICAHTNLDVAVGGVNDVLAEALGLTECSVLEPAGEDANGNTVGIGRVGLLQGAEEGLTLEAFAARVKGALKTQAVRCADGGRRVHKVAVGGGACGDMLEAVAALECDTFVTADVKYNVFLDAKAMGINLIDAGHFATENLICPVLAAELEGAFPSLVVHQTQVHTQIPCYL